MCILRSKVVKRWLISAATLYLILITVLSLVKFSSDMSPSQMPIDKVVHFCFYFGLNVLVQSVVSLYGQRLKIAMTMFVIAYGGIIELLQPYVGRCCDVDDFITNSIGAAVGLLVFVCFRIERLWLGKAGQP